MSGITPEVLDRLGLSDEAKELLQPELAKAAKLSGQLRDAEVKSRIDDLKKEGFDQMPGLLKEIEAIMLSDDGDIALTLKLSTDGVETKTPQTATQIVNRLIAALPCKDEKVALSAQGSLLESPSATRPDLKPENGEHKKKTGDDLLAEWNKHAPEAVATLKLAGNGAAKE